ncbi:outer membrane autotransporter protein [Bradyrhizobium sp. USDA 4501]
MNHNLTSAHILARFGHGVSSRMRALLCSTALVELLVILPGAAAAQTITTTQTAVGPGVTLTLTNETIRTSGTSALAQNGGTITLNGGAATSTGGGTVLQAGYQGASITATNVDISGGVGVYANPDSTINVIGGTITTTGNGLWQTDGGATTNADGVTIKTSGNNSVGAEYSGGGATAYGTGVMTLKNVTITTEGTASYGVAQSQSFSVGASSPVLDSFTGKLVMTGGAITTSGVRAVGLFANTLNIVALSDVTINTSGTQGFGVMGQYGARITLDNVRVSTTGDFAYGLYGVLDHTANGAPTVISGTDVTVRTAGRQAHGLRVMGSSTITLADSTVTTTGVDAAAINANAGKVIASGASGPGTVNVTNSTLTSEQGYGIWATGTQNAFVDTFSRLNVNLTDSALTSSTSAWLYAQSGISTDRVPVHAIVTVDADHSQLTGFARTDSGSTTDVTLRNGSLWTMTGSSNLTTLANNGSTIDFVGPTGDPTLLTSYKTLTIANYSGAGGAISLNTYLGDDSSPSDRVVINGGKASGNTSLYIKNAGGTGALTTGNGILVVDTINGGTTANGAFTLGTRTAAGAYDYRLFRGSVDASEPENWYLRSTVDCTLPGGLGVSECDGGGGGEVSIYRPEVIVDTAIPALASRFGLGMLGTWHERTGGEFATNYVTADGHQQAGWGRIFGDAGRYGMGFGGRIGDRSTAFDSHGPSYDFAFGGIQAGMDLMRRENGDGSRDLVGFYVGAGSARADVHSVTDFGFGSNAGRMSMDAYSLGAYYTHIGSSGWYVDAVLQGTYYADISATSNINEAQTLKTSGGGLLASLEGGYPIALGQGFTFEPQAQVVYQHLGFGDGADKFGRIAFNDSDAWYGRLSGRLSRDWTREDGRTVMAWARAGVWTDFGAQAKTTFSNLDSLNPTTFGTDLGGTLAQFDLGVSTQLSDKVSVFAVGDYNVSLTSTDGHSFGGRAGLKVAF